MKEEISRSFYTRGSMIHRGLERIARCSMTEQEWRTQTENISMQRFFQYVIDPLKKDGFVKNLDGFWFITKTGEERLFDLGPTKKIRVRNHKEDLVKTTYDGAELRNMVTRPGAQDFLNYPSRRFNQLHYRDGRVEVMA
jgi:hypothetical protein